MGKLKRYPSKYRLRGSTATYRLPSRKNDVCDLDELAERYRDMGQIPERFSFIKAAELQLMASAFYLMRKYPAPCKRCLKLRPKRGKHG